MPSTRELARHSRATSSRLPVFAPATLLPIAARNCTIRRCEQPGSQRAAGTDERGVIITSHGIPKARFNLWQRGVG